MWVGGPFGNPVGLDGVVEASCPPRHSSMDAAVEAVLFRRAAIPQDRSLTGCRRPSTGGRALRFSDEGLACTKAVCNYIFETFGRFPGDTDAMHLMWVFQAHHIDTDYYDRFFGSEAYGPQHAAHMSTWHR